MTQEHPHHPDLDRYLDGLLEGAEKEAFERALAHDAELRAAVERDRAVQASLERLFAPGANAEAEAEADAASRILARAIDQDRDGRRGGGGSTIADNGALDAARASVDATGDAFPTDRADKPPSRPASSESRSPGRALRFPALRQLALAASMALGLLGAYLIWDFFQPPIDPYHRPPQTLAEFYTSAVNADMEPDWICETDRQFVTTFWQRLGHGARLAENLPDGLVALGISYPNTISPKTVALLAEYQGEPIVIYVDRLSAVRGNGEKDEAADREPWRIDPDSELRQYRREAPPLIFIEVSRLDQPHMLEHLEPAEMPEAWIPGRNRPTPGGGDKDDQGNGGPGG